MQAEGRCLNAQKEKKEEARLSIDTACARNIPVMAHALHLPIYQIESLRVSCVGEDVIHGTFTFFDTTVIMVSNAGKHLKVFHR